MFKAYTKYVFVLFLLIASCGQSFARAHSLVHGMKDCVMANTSANTNSSLNTNTITNPASAVSAARKTRVHSTHEEESLQDTFNTNRLNTSYVDTHHLEHANHSAHTTSRMSGEEIGSMAMSTNDKMAMNDGNCCFDECICETGTCSNASLVAVIRHSVTALTFSEHVVVEQRGKPKSISSSLFRPPIIG
jgi:hypothetical protein